MRISKLLYALVAGGAAAMLALSATPASATVITTVGNQSNIFFDDDPTNGDNTVDLGDFNLAVAPVGVTANFAANKIDAIDGSFEFGVFSDPAAFGAFGSVDVNLTLESADADFSAVFDGAPLNFTLEQGDWVTSFSTTFSDINDIANFALSFTGFNSGDTVQVNVEPTAVPEPATIGLFGLALLGLGLATRRRRRSAA